MALCTRKGMGIAVLLLMACFFSAAHAVKMVDCSPQDAPVQLVGVKLFPDPAVTGEDFVLTISANSSIPIKRGIVYIWVTKWNIPVHFERDELCDKTDSCPIAAGHVFKFSHGQNLPSATPTGAYSVKITAWDQDNLTLFCARVDFDIKAKATVVARHVAWYDWLFQRCKHSHKKEGGRPLLRIA